MRVSEAGREFGIPQVILMYNNQGRNHCLSQPSVRNAENVGQEPDLWTNGKFTNPTLTMTHASGLLRNVSRRGERRELQSGCYSKVELPNKIRDAQLNFNFK